MDEYINKAAFLKAIANLKQSAWYNDDDWYGTRQARHDGVAAVVDLLEEQPVSDVVEVRHGVWLPIEIEEWFYSCVDKRTVYKCSLCGRYEDRQEPYCNCGAKMDGKGDNND